jgi:phosphotransferase system IIB component
MLKSLLSFDNENDRIILIVIIAAAALVLIALAIFLVKILGKKRVKVLPIASKSEYFEALGGEDNYIDSSRDGSRIVVHLKDYSKINKEKIKEAGVTGFIEKSDKLTLVVKDNAEEVYEKIFNA